MSNENVQPLFPESDAIQKRALEFVDWMRAQIESNEVAAVTIRGIGADGETFRFDIVPIGSDTLRYTMIGQLEEAKAMLTVEP